MPLSSGRKSQFIHLKWAQNPQPERTCHRLGKSKWLSDAMAVMALKMAPRENRKKELADSTARQPPKGEGKQSQKSSSWGAGIDSGQALSPEKVQQHHGADERWIQLVPDPYQFIWNRESRREFGIQVSSLLRGKCNQLCLTLPGFFFLDGCMFIISGKQKKKNAICS